MWGSRRDPATAAIPKRTEKLELWTGSSHSPLVTVKRESQCYVIGNGALGSPTVQVIDVGIGVLVWKHQTFSLTAV